MGYVPPQIAATRRAMMNAGFRYAIGDLPGAYVPTPASTGISKPSDWIVDLKNLIASLESSGSDPDVVRKIKKRLC